MAVPRQFIEPDCPACGRGVGFCVNVRTGEMIRTPHPGRTAALVTALYAEVAYLQGLLAPQVHLPTREAVWDDGWQAGFDAASHPGELPEATNPYRE